MQIEITARTFIPNILSIVEFDYKQKSYSAIVPISMLNEPRFCENLVKSVLGVKVVEVEGGNV